MTEPGPYATAAGVEAAIKAAARKAAAADPSLNVNQRIRLQYFDRFLCRVFSEGADSEWLLKGGTGMLARVPSTRSTLDIDLYRDGFTPDQALTDLRRLADVDLEDHFRFVYSEHSDSIGGEQQPYTDGYRVIFDVYLGVQKKSDLRVDLAVGAGLTDQVTAMKPASALNLPRLVSHEYRLYPVVDQIADKVCATMATYRGQPSSREKDLVDLVVLAVTQEVDGASLRVAISTEARRRKLELFDHLVIPDGWGSAYAREAKDVPYCTDYHTVDLARDLMARFIDPALDGTANGKRWSPEQREWT